MTAGRQEFALRVRIIDNDHVHEDPRAKRYSRVGSRQKHWLSKCEVALETFTAHCLLLAYLRPFVERCHRDQLCWLGKLG